MSGVFTPHTVSALTVGPTFAVDDGFLLAADTLYMQAYFSRQRLQIPAALNRQGFILVCLAASAGLSWLVNKSLITVELFGVSLALVFLVSLVIRFLTLHPERRRWLVPITILTLVGVLVLSRYGRFQLAVFGTTVGSHGEWVGLSYLVFRLIHVVVDSKRIKSVPTGDLAAYALFPAALIAGPIHRFQPFATQLAGPHHPSSQRATADCLWRISLGAVKKLVLANFLLNFALDANIATNPQLSRGFLLLSLVAYAFMLYFDFSGYSDIAIGVAGLMGIQLPENFANPYAQPNITRFWQSWHISLSSWLRDYIFFPLSRFLLDKFGRNFTVPIMAVAHLTTMALAGLWHGFAPGFVVWGLWHGVGLFIHAQWDRVVKQRGGQGVPSAFGIALTFIFVSIGWIFFALPDLPNSLAFIKRLITG